MTQGLPFEILLVDDDEDDRYFMDQAFIEIGYTAEVKKFIGGKDLLNYLETVDKALLPSLIVLDDQLPGLNADDILAIIKADETYQHIPVIIYSGVVSPSRKKQFLEMGAYAYVEKGINFNDSILLARELKELAESRHHTSR